MTTIDIPIDPVGKGRPRFTKDGHAYTPQKTKIAEDMIRFYWTVNKCKMSHGEIGIRIIAHYPIPKSYTKKKAQECLDGNIRPTVKPDIDNVTKLILDALNGLAYEDDKDIVYIKIEKKYSTKGHLEIRVAGTEDAQIC